MIRWLFRPKYSTTIINCPDVDGGGLYFAHPFCTILNAEHIGYGCAFMHNTTLGNREINGKNYRPWLGNHVEVGCNVVIIGKVKIGNNVKIGAGTMILKDVPDNCTVIGNPARIVKIDGKKCNILL